MPLIKDFYAVEHTYIVHSHHCYADVTIYQQHPIFKGHFPGHPVTPGVCMLQIIKELGENWAASPLRLKIAKHMKFLAVINPFEHAQVRVNLLFEDLEDGLLSVKSTASFGETTALKFHGVFQKIRVLGPWQH